MTRLVRPRLALLLPPLAATCFTVHCGSGDAPREPERRGNEAAPASYQGQSGSEVTDGDPPGGETVPCPCSYPGWLGRGMGPLLRVTLLERSDESFESAAYPWCRAGATAVEFGELPPRCSRLRLRVEEVLLGDIELASGTELEALSDGYLPCYRGADAVAPGEQALAAINWDGGSPPDAGITAEQVVNVRLSPWGDSIVFAETPQAKVSVPVSELPELAGDLLECIDRFGDWASLPGAFPDGNIP